jgi:hypothetical protein
MSTEQIPGQMSMTAGEIRDALDRIEAGYPEDPQWIRPLHMIEDAKLIRDLADRLISEQVADARTAEHDTMIVRLEQAGDDAGDRLALVERGRARGKKMYGWDVIGWILQISGEAARLRYGR